MKTKQKAKSLFYSVFFVLRHPTKKWSKSLQILYNLVETVLLSEQGIYCSNGIYKILTALSSKELPSVFCLFLRTLFVFWRHWQRRLLSIAGDQGFHMLCTFYNVRTDPHSKMSICSQGGVYFSFWFNLRFWQATRKKLKIYKSSSVCTALPLHHLLFEKKFLDWVIIWGDKIVPLILRLSGIDSDLVWY